MEFGVNPNEASTAGSGTQTASGEMPSLGKKFAELLNDCSEGAGDTGAGPGFRDFGERNRKGIEDTGTHGHRTGGHTKEVASRATDTDLDIKGQYDGSTAGVPSLPSISRTIN